MTTVDMSVWEGRIDDAEGALGRRRHPPAVGLGEQIARGGLAGDALGGEEGGIAAVPRELNYVAKGELFRIPIFRALIRYVGAVPIRRGTFDRRCFDVLRTRAAPTSARLSPPRVIP